MTNNKIMLLLALLLSVTGIKAQEVTIGTKLPYGETMSFRMTPANTADSIFVDWGNGTLKGYKLGTGRYDPKVINASGKLYGDTVRIKGSLKNLTIQEDSVTVLKFAGQTNLTSLNATHNLLTTDGLDLTGAPNIETLRLEYNQINNINLSGMLSLNTFNISNNPHFYTAVFADGSTSLQYIDMNDCEVVHFYPYNLPNLKSVNIENGALQDIELGNHYPALTKLDLYGNKLLSSVDVSKLTELENLNVGATAINELNISQNAALKVLNVSNTNLRNIDLKNNPNIETFNAKLSKLTKLDLSAQTNLQELYVDSTDIARLDLVGKRFISQVKARNTKIEFLDLHDCMGYNRLSLLDIRDNKNMTPQTLNFTYQAMPFHDGASRSRNGDNVLLAGSNAEHSNTNLIPRDASNYYNVDVQGDSTASMDSVALTLETVEGGTYSLKQTTGVNDDLAENFVLKPITTKAKPGYPISVIAVPAEGYTYKGVEVNGKLYEDTIFVVSAAATVKPVFVGNSGVDVIKLTVTPATPQEYMLAAVNEGTQVQVDWGNGSPVTYTLGPTKTTSVSCESTYGSTVTITGAVAYADFSSYPPIANDNKITAIDLSGNANLQYLNLFTNELKSLDLSNETNLRTLNIGNCELGTLDLSANTKLRTLKARSNALNSLDLSHNPELLSAELVGNNLTTLDLSNNTKLQDLNVATNKLTSVNLSKNTALETLSLQSNKLTSVDLSKNTALKSLDVSDNALTEIDLSNNTALESFYAWGNTLAVPDLSNLTNLKTINVSNNAWDACELNDFYYHLPECATTSTTVNLTAQAYSGSSVADNDADHAESTLATGKGWTINKKGDATGCDKSYVTVLPYTNGTVKLFNSENVEIPSGTAVAKNSVITVQATPADGYVVKTLKANGANIVENKFTITRATDVLAEFTVSTAIDGVTTSETRVSGGNHELLFSTTSPVSVSVYGTAGDLIFSDSVSDGQAIGLPAGIYIVKVGGVTKKIIVK